jgi:hypothetical protein
MKNFIKAIFTDGEWDGDATKFIGFLIVVAGLTGFFMSKQGFEIVIAFGAGLIATGKFSKQG